MKTKQISLSIASACVALLCATTLSLRATTYWVQNNNDSLGGSLRAWLGVVVDGDTLMLTNPGTITLTSGELVVASSVTIQGLGPGLSVVNGNRGTRVFNVTGSNVFISGLTISNAYTSAYGGGIYGGPGRPGSSLTVSNCIVTNNFSSGSGGGIYNDVGRTLTVKNCVVSGNSTSYRGGGIFNYAVSSNATAIVSASVVRGNTATDRGGGIYNGGWKGNATLILDANTIISGNAANWGGGIYSEGNAGNATVTSYGSTLSGNTANNDGGCIYNDGRGSGIATVTINGGTISTNSAPGNGGAVLNNGEGSLGTTLNISNCLLYANRATGWGGAIFNDGQGSGARATLNLNICTLSNNLAGVNGGSVANDAYSSGNAALTVTNCLFSGNRAYQGGGIHNYGYGGIATMTMAGSTVTGNSAFDGGGIYSDGESSGTMTLAIYGSTLSSNIATNNGGAICNNGYNNGNVTATLGNCLLSANSSTHWGGGIYNDGYYYGHATLTLNACTLSGNSAVDTGGVIYNTGYQYGSAMLTNIGCTFSGNMAGTNGGAIFNDGRYSGSAWVIVINSAFTGNLADMGGAIHNLGSLTVQSSQFTNNVAQGAAGQTSGLGGGGGGAAGLGGAIFSDVAVLTLSNSVFSGNRAIGGKGGDGVHNTGSPLGGNGGGPFGGLGGQSGIGGAGDWASGGGGGYGCLNCKNAGGHGGFGGGGGGGGGSNNGDGGGGGSGGLYGGNGGMGAYSWSGSGGGGAGLGGAVFANSNSGPVTVLGCMFTGNLATNGLHGADPYNAQSGQGVGGALFSLVTSVLVQNSTFTNNVASTFANDLDWPFLVVTLADGDPGSLRQVLASATNRATTITFGVSGTITLTSGPLNLTSNVTILGPGPGLLTVSGNNSSGVFNVTGTNVTLSGLTVANGYNATNGAGINAVGVPGGRITLNNCVVTNNSTDGSIGGGGVFINPGVALLITNSTICGNTANYYDGGGIYNFHGNLTVVNSTLSGNSAHAGGGGIYNDGSSSSATLTLANSTLSGNSAGVDGGGIYNNGSGGGATLTVNACTFGPNAFSRYGSALYNSASGTGVVRIADCIIYNTGTSNRSIYSSSGAVNSLGYNLLSDAGGASFVSGTNDQLSVGDPKLGPLQDNGGPTWTHALLPGSPAIDKGKCNALTNLVPATDQRCLTRAVNLPSCPNVLGGDGSDIGAYELQVDLVAITRPGFYTNGGGWALNGTTTNGGPQITNNVFALTDAGVLSERRSAWFPSRLYVGGFQASFVYQDISGTADGVAFVIQNDPLGTAALGGLGGGLGYVGITKSAAVLLNIYSGAPGGRGLMLGTNGIGAYNLDDSTLSGRYYQGTSPVNLAGGNPIAVVLRYAGGILYVSLSNTVTTAQFQTSVPVDIPALAGTNAAWVGFTGASGGEASYQIVSNFSYRPLPAMSIQQSQPASLVFAWPAAVYGFALQSNPSLNNPAGWTSVAGTITQSDNLNQVTVLSPTGAAQFYRLVLPGGP